MDEAGTKTAERGWSETEVVQCSGYIPHLKEKAMNTTVTVQSVVVLIVAVLLLR